LRHDPVERHVGGEHGRDAQLAQRRMVLARDRAPDEQLDVTGLAGGNSPTTSDTSSLWLPERMDRPTASTPSSTATCAICAGLRRSPV